MSQNNKEEIVIKQTRFAICLALLTLLLVSFFSKPSGADLLPAADREGAERYFSEAYEHFIAREYTTALASLDRSLELNTYFVDYYLMRGLVLHRIGRGEEAVKSIRYYLEVRPKDSAAPRILERLWYEELFIREFISGEPINSRIVSSQKDLKRILSLNTLSTLGVLGLGKVTSFGDGVFIADTLGDKIVLRLPDESHFKSVDVESPVAALPMGDRSFFIVSEKGDILKVEEGASSPVIVGSLPLMPSDAALLSNGLLAVSSAVNRSVSIYSFPGLELVKTIVPALGDHLFEPVALSAYGGWLAIADRGNNRVAIHSLFDEGISFFVDVDEPRDLTWSSFGDLFILNEAGEVSRGRISIARRMVTEFETVLTGAAHGWSLFPVQDKVYCLDISASKIWEMFPVPLGDGFASLSLSAPSISREEENESFILDGFLCGPFRTYLSNNTPIISSVWNERLLVGSYTPKMPDHPGTTLFFKTAENSAPQGDVERKAASGGDVLNSLMEEWDARRGAVANIVLSAATPFSREEACRLAGFCLRNRVRIFVYADTVPSLELLRAATLSDGSVVFVPNGVWGAFPPYSTGTVKMVLPTDESSSGFPSKSTLSVYLDIGVIPTKDWIPLWPDLL
ncbi:MAG: hypothetical protein WCY56_01090 [Aminobacteriaceae bacterium]